MQDPLKVRLKCSIDKGKKSQRKRGGSIFGKKNNNVDDLVFDTRKKEKEVWTMELIKMVRLC